MTNPEVRLIDANALYNDLKESVKAAREWREEAQEEEIKIRAEQAHGTFCECALRVKNAPTIDAEPVKWIPCSERLPESFIYVLCTGRDGIGILRYIGSKWLDDEALVYTTNEITHWMPLPEPPKE